MALDVGWVSTAVEDIVEFLTVRLSLTFDHPRSGVAAGLLREDEGDAVDGDSSNKSTSMGPFSILRHFVIRDANVLRVLEEGSGGHGSKRPGSTTTAPQRNVATAGATSAAGGLRAATIGKVEAQTSAQPDSNVSAPRCLFFRVTRRQQSPPEAPAAASSASGGDWHDDRRDTGEDSELRLYTDFTSAMEGGRAGGAAGHATAAGEDLDAYAEAPHLDKIAYVAAPSTASGVLLRVADLSYGELVCGSQTMLPTGRDPEVNTEDISAAGSREQTEHDVSTDARNSPPLAAAALHDLAESLTLSVLPLVRGQHEHAASALPASPALSPYTLLSRFGVVVRSRKELLESAVSVANVWPEVEADRIVRAAADECAAERGNNDGATHAARVLPRPPPSRVTARAVRLMVSWIQFCEGLLVETHEERMRQRNAGPHIELWYWEARCAHVAAALRQSETSTAGALRGVVEAYRQATWLTVKDTVHIDGVIDPLRARYESLTRLVKSWDAVLVRLRQATVAARAAAVYLHSMDPIVQCLYKSTPDQLVESIPNVVQAVVNTVGASNVLQRPGNATALLVQIGQQLRQVCTAYLRDLVRSRGSDTDRCLSRLLGKRAPRRVGRAGGLWAVPADALLTRIRACLLLHARFRIAFFAICRTQSGSRHKGSDKGERAESVVTVPGASQGVEYELAVDPSWVFARFDALALRLARLARMVHTSDSFCEFVQGSILHLNVDNVRKQVITLISVLLQRDYDILDPGPELDSSFNDHTEWRAQMWQKVRKGQADGVTGSPALITADAVEVAAMLGPPDVSSIPGFNFALGGGELGGVSNGTGVAGPVHVPSELNGALTLEGSGTPGRRASNRAPRSGAPAATPEVSAEWREAMSLDRESRADVQSRGEPIFHLPTSRSGRKRRPARRGVLSTPRSKPSEHAAAERVRGSSGSWRPHSSTDSPRAEALFSSPVTPRASSALGLALGSVTSPRRPAPRLVVRESPLRRRVVAQSAPQRVKEAGSRATPRAPAVDTSPVMQPSTGPKSVRGKQLVANGAAVDGSSAHALSVQKILSLPKVTSTRPSFEGDFVAFERLLVRFDEQVAGALCAETPRRRRREAAGYRARDGRNARGSPAARRHLALMDAADAWSDDETTEFKDDEAETNGTEPLKSEMYSKRALELLSDASARFAVLRRPAVAHAVRSRVEAILNTYSEEIQVVRSEFLKHKHAPPLPRGWPAAAGAVAWVRQLRRRIEEPMRLLDTWRDQVPTVSTIAGSRECESTASGLRKYEMLLHHRWYQTSVHSDSRRGLTRNLLARDDEPGAPRRLLVNFDTSVSVLTREAVHFHKLGLAVPASVMTVAQRSGTLTAYRDALSQLLARRARILHQAGVALVTPLVRPILAGMEEVFEPALSSLTWASADIPSFLTAAGNAVSGAENVVVKVDDVWKMQIQPQLARLRKTNILHLSGFSIDASADLVDTTVAAADDAGSDSEELSDSFRDSRGTTDIFVDLCEEQIEAAATAMAAANAAIESGARQLVNLVLARHEPGSSSFRKCVLLSGTLMHQLECMAFDATKDAVVRTLRSFRSRLASRQRGLPFFQAAMFRVSVKLEAPRATLDPSLSVVQAAINTVAQSVVSLPKRLTRWYPSVLEARPVISDAVDKDAGSVLPVAPRETFFETLGKSIEVLRAVLQITGTLRGLEDRVSRYVASFGEYQHLWREEPEALVAAFVQSQLSTAVESVVEKFENKIHQYMQTKAELQGMRETRRVDSVLLDAQPLLGALVSRAEARQAAFGAALLRWTRQRISRLLSLFDETKSQLEMPADTLEVLSTTMDKLDWLRMMEASIDFELRPIAAGFDVLRRYGFQLEREDEGSVERIQRAWVSLKDFAEERQFRLQQEEPRFRALLESESVAIKQAVQLFASKWNTSGPSRAGLPLEAARRCLTEYEAEFFELHRRIRGVTLGCRVFGISAPSYEAVHQIESEIAVLAPLFALAADVDAAIGRRMAQPLESIDAEEVDAEMSAFALQSRDLPVEARRLAACSDLTATLSSFRVTVPLAAAIGDPRVRERHWRALDGVLAATLPRPGSDTFTMNGIADVPLARHKDAVEAICLSARKEADIEEKFEHVRKLWQYRTFDVAPVNERGVVGVVEAGASALASDLDEAEVNLATLSSSRYHLHFGQDLRTWVQRIAQVREVLEPLMATQAAFLHVDAVFAAGDVGWRLPDEARRVAALTKAWNRVMGRIAAQPNVIYVCCTNDAVRFALPGLLKQLEQCKHALAGYLESKRNDFPRFNLVSDASLLELLARGADVRVVTAHLDSMFDGVQGLCISPRGADSGIIGVRGSLGEQLLFEPRHDLVPDIAVESWLSDLLSATRAGVDAQQDRAALIVSTALSAGVGLARAYALLLIADDIHHTVASVAGLPEDFVVPDTLSDEEATVLLVEGLTGQVCVMAARLLWTANCETYFSQLTPRGGAADSAFGLVSARLNELIEVAATLFSQPRRSSYLVRERMQDPQAHKRTRVVLENLITVEVYHRDVAASLLQERVASADAFEWRKHIRCYYGPRVPPNPTSTSTSGVNPVVGGVATDRAPPLASGRVGSAGDDLHGIFRVELTDVAEPYDREYLSARAALVLTPLTLRCFVTLAQAVQIGFGGLPAGPAGTGKTESIRDFGRTLGRFVVVMTCSDGMDIASLARCYRAAAGAGMWIDLDEFNRLDVGVMSLAASHVAALLNAVRAEADFVHFPGSDPCVLRKTAGLFITMNPGYEGRHELPQTVRSQFRQVAMVVPDTLLIVRVKLASLGMLSGAVLASQLVRLLETAKESFSATGRGDFGLRTAIAVVRSMESYLTASLRNHASPMQERRSAERTSAQSAESVRFDSGETRADFELRVMMDAVRTVMLPPLQLADAKLFLKLVASCFPLTTLRNGNRTSSVLPKWWYKDFAAAAEQEELCPTEEFISKAEQLWSAVTIRTGIIVVGPSAAGKTSLLRAVATTCNSIASQALSQANLRRTRPRTSVSSAHGSENAPYELIQSTARAEARVPRVRTSRVYPKAVSRHALFGYDEPTTMSWCDGVIPAIWRRARAQDQSSRPRRSGPTRPSEAMWLVLDGPIDPTWAESFNGVMDDSRTLTLQNGERLPLPSGARVLFECTSLQHASPATISRCGIVALNATTVGWRGVLSAWVIGTSTAVVDSTARSSAGKPNVVDARQVVALIAGYWEQIYLAMKRFTASDVHSAATCVEQAAATLLSRVLEAMTLLSKCLTADPKLETSHPGPVAGAWFFEANTARLTRWARLFAFTTVSFTMGSMDATARSRYDACLRAMTGTMPELRSVLSQAAVDILTRGEDGDSWAVKFSCGRKLARLSMPPLSDGSESAFDFALNESAEWQPWSQTRVERYVQQGEGAETEALMSPWRLAGAVPLSQQSRMCIHGIFISSAPMRRLRFWLAVLIRSGRNIMVVGPEVSGKTLTLREFAKQLVSSSEAAHVAAVRAARELLAEEAVAAQEAKLSRTASAPIDLVLDGASSAKSPRSTSQATGAALPRAATAAVDALRSAGEATRLSSAKMRGLVSSKAKASSTKVQVPPPSKHADIEAGAIVSPGVTVFRTRQLLFSSSTTIASFQRGLESHMRRGAGGSFGAPQVTVTVPTTAAAASSFEEQLPPNMPTPTPRLAVFIEDVSTPPEDEWGHSHVEELLRQISVENGYYSNTQVPRWHSLHNLQLIVSCNLQAQVLRPSVPPEPIDADSSSAQQGQHRAPVDPRLSEHFHLLHTPRVSDAIARSLMSRVSGDRFRSASPTVKAAAKMLGTLTVALIHHIARAAPTGPNSSELGVSLRDGAAILGGLLRIEPAVLHTPALLLEAWRHEAEREIRDRAACGGHFVTVFDRAVAKSAGTVASHLLDSRVAAEQSCAVHFEELARSTDARPMCDFAGRPTSETALLDEMEVPVVGVHAASVHEDALFEREYAFVDVDLKDRLRTFVKWYDERPPESVPSLPHEVPKLRLVLIREVVQHTTRVARVLSTKNRHAVLLGDSGCGKASIARLAAFVSGWHTVQLQETLRQSTGQLPAVSATGRPVGAGSDEFRSVIRASAIFGKRVVVVASDYNLRDNGMVVCLHHTLSGLAPLDLFEPDEAEALVSDLRAILASSRAGEAVAPGETADMELLRTAFNSRVAANLKVIVTLQSATLKTWVQRMPSLKRYCTLDLVEAWSPQSRTEVADAMIRDGGLMPVAACRATTSQVAKFVSSVHAKQGGLSFAPSVPLALRSMIDTTRSLVRQRAVDSDKQLAELQRGLTAIAAAKEQVTELGATLKMKQAELEVQRKRLHSLLEEIRERTDRAESERQKIELEQRDIEVGRESVARDLEVVQNELALADPLIEAALRSLRNISSGDVAALRTFSHPPNLIKRILDGVLVLRQLPLQRVTPDAEFDDGRITPSWGQSVKELMSSLRFLNSLRNFNKASINDETVELLQPYLEMDDFDAASARLSCGNVAGVCTWVRGLTEWYAIQKSVLPKKRAVEETQERLDRVEAELRDTIHRLFAVEQQIERATADYEAAMAEKDHLEREAASIQSRMAAATALLDNVSGEASRWRATVAQLQRSATTIVGDCSAVAVFLTFAGSLHMEERASLFGSIIAEADKLKLELSKELRGCTDDPASNFTAVTTWLTPTALQLIWQEQGLPQDPIAISNALIMTSCILVPRPSRSDAAGTASHEASALLETRQEPVQSTRSSASSHLARSDSDLSMSQKDIDDTAYDSVSSSSVLEEIRRDRQRLCGLGIRRTPLIVDPQEQALGWILRQFDKPGDIDATDGISVVSEMDGVDAVTARLAECAARGRPLLIRDASSPLVPQVRDVINFLASDRGLGLTWIGDREIAIAQDFFLVVVTAETRPVMDAALCGTTCVLDFSITAAGLLDRLQKHIVKREHPDRHERRNELENEAVTLGVRSIHVRKTLLHRLSSSSGTLIEDQHLVRLLHQAGATALRLDAKARRTSQAVASLREAALVYRPCAVRCKVLYFAAQAMGNANPAYQTLSLKFLLKLVDSALSRVPSDLGSATSRVAVIERFVTRSIIAAVSRGMFARDRIVFLLLVTTQVDIEAGLLSKATACCMRPDITGEVGSEVGTSPIRLGKAAELLIEECCDAFQRHANRRHDAPLIDREPPVWLPASVWSRLQHIASIPLVQRAVREMCDGPDDREPKRSRAGGAAAGREPASSAISWSWKDWYFSTAPEERPLPGIDEDEVGDGGNDAEARCQRCVLVSTLRPDRALIAAEKYVDGHPDIGLDLRQSGEGVHYETQDGASTSNGMLQALAAALSDADSARPLLVLLSDSSDPAAAIAELADRAGAACSIVAAGRGQEAVVRDAIAAAVEDGSWLIVENVHLSSALLRSVIELAVRRNQQGRQAINSAHRLVVTCDPTWCVPAQLLHLCTPVAVEAPSSVRAGTVASFTGLSRTTLAASDRPEAWRRILFTLCFFHSVLQSRCRYGAIGWSSRIQFSDADLGAGVRYLLRTVRGTISLGGVDWPAVQFVLCDVLLGGQVADEHDRRVLAAYSRAWFRDEMALGNFPLAGPGVIATSHSSSLSVAASAPPASLGTQTAPTAAKFIVPGEVAADEAALLEHIKRTLPSTDAPSSILLPDCVGFTMRATEATVAFATLARAQDAEHERQIRPELVGTYKSTESELEHLKLLLQALPGEVASVLSEDAGHADDADAADAAADDGARATAHRKCPLDVDRLNAASIGSGDKMPWLLRDGSDALNAQRDFVRSEARMLWRSLKQATADIHALLTRLRDERALPETLARVLEAIRAARVPHAWDHHATSGRGRRSPGSWQLGSWLRFKHCQAAQLTSWIAHGAPQHVWLGGLHKPRALFTAMLRCTAEARGETCTIERLRFTTSVLKTAVTAASSGEKTAGAAPIDNPTHSGVASSPDCLCVVGLRIQGAAWDESTMSLTTARHEGTQLPVEEPVSPMPPVVVSVVPIADAKMRAANATGGWTDAAFGEAEAGGARSRRRGGARSWGSARSVARRNFTCPVYRFAARGSNNLVVHLQLPTLLPLEHLYVRGVVLLCGW